MQAALQGMLDAVLRARRGPWLHPESSPVGDRCQVSLLSPLSENTMFLPEPSRAAPGPGGQQALEVQCDPPSVARRLAWL